MSRDCLWSSSSRACALILKAADAVKPSSSAGHGDMVLWRKDVRTRAAEEESAAASLSPSAGFYSPPLYSQPAAKDYTPADT